MDIGFLKVNCVTKYIRDSVKSFVKNRVNDVVFSVVENSVRHFVLESLSVEPEVNMNEFYRYERIRNALLHERFS